MSIESALATHLRTDAILSGLSVGVYPNVAPQSASYPLGVYQVISGSPEFHLGGASTLSEFTIDISVYSTTISEREQIATRIKNLLHGYRGALGTEALDVRNILLQSVQTFSESDLDGTDEQIYRSNLSFIFHFNWS